MSERNDEIIKQYTEGATLKVLAAKHRLSLQTVRNIVRKAGVYRKAPAREAFLGVDVTAETKEALRAEAERRGVSVSRLTSDTLEEMLQSEMK